MKTPEVVAKLLTMATKAGEAMYERAKLAASCLEDRQWIDAEFGGDYDVALEYIEGDCFPDLAGGFGLSRLLEIIAKFPERNDWRADKWNINRMWARIVDAKREADDKPERQVRPRPTAKDLEERDTKIAEKDWTIKTQQQALERELGEVEKLRLRVTELEAEVNQLRGENKQLTKMIEMMRDGRTVPALAR